MAPKTTPPVNINITNLPDLSGDDVLEGNYSGDYSVSAAGQTFTGAIIISPTYIDPIEETNKNMLAVTVENIEIKKRMAKIEKAMEILIIGSGK